MTVESLLKHLGELVPQPNIPDYELHLTCYQLAQLHQISEPTVRTVIDKLVSSAILTRPDRWDQNKVIIPTGVKIPSSQAELNQLRPTDPPPPAQIAPNRITYVTDGRNRVDELRLGSL